MKNKQVLDSLAKIFKSNNADLFLVGGATRSFFLNKTYEDIDICGCLSPLEVKSILKSSDFIVDDASAKFGTLILTSKLDFTFKAEYTTFRADHYAGDGTHEPSAVSFCESLALDSARRDFTINAIYENILTGEIIDLYGGITDIKLKRLKTIKAPLQTFLEDALRILRLARFSFSLDFNIEKATFRSAQKLCPLILNLSPERIIYELNKILFNGNSLLETVDNAKLCKMLFNKNAINILNKLNISKILFKKNIKVDNYLTFIDIIYKNPKIDSKLLTLYLAKNKAELKYSASTIVLLDKIKSTKNLQALKSVLVKNKNLLPTVLRLNNDRHKNQYIAAVLTELDLGKIPKDISELNISGLELNQNFGYEGKQISDTLFKLFELVINYQLKNEKTAIVNYIQKEKENDN